ncbi:helix-hairpin-helix domain-containing protein [Sphingomonas sp. AAP5]|uniref:helix-hairpin-helix domain-containing protein n=1 Tax=Sphingomonas sp. AAP5 TaxID=1523415 RepID=UPI0019D17DAA|nr:hypothetical protein [Sphingomonas sp. AAP5]
MMPLRLTSAGKLLLLGPRIGRGGEGEIYALADGSGRAAKLYIQPDAIREAKISAMIASPAVAACPDAAFPQDIVRHEDGRFAGFVMAQVTGHQPIHELLGASSRRQFFAHADWPFLVRVAVNLARVVASIHGAGIVIGDINSSGILVSQRGTVKLIDADSFQIGSHRCRVGMVEYTPPELQGVAFGGVDRTPNHDDFGLATIVFQLLMLGWHPFSGVSRGRQVALNQAIRDGRFVFSHLADVGAKPPPNSLLLGDLPRGVRHLFERAFLPVGNTRPPAAEWVRALSDLEAGLIPCPVRTDHIMAPVSMQCPWCRIERATGRTMFAQQKSVIVPVPDPVIERLRADVANMVGRAKRHAGEGIEPPWYERRPEPSKAAVSLAGGGNSLKQSGDVAELLDKRQDAILKAERALARWRMQIGVWEVTRLLEQVKGSVAKLERFENRRAFLLSIAVAQSVQLRVTGVLAGHPLTGSRVPGVGAALIVTLARHDVVNVADLARDRLAAITGVGEKRILALLLWRDGLSVAAEKEIRRSARRLEEIRIEAAAKVVNHRVALERSVRIGLAELKNTIDLVYERASRTDTALAAALRARDQAKADVALIGSAPTALSPANRMIQQPASATITKSRKSKKGGGSAKPGKICPCCGGPMVKRWGGANGGKAFHYGCSAYPSCKGVRAAPGRGGRP